MRILTVLAFAALFASVYGATSEKDVGNQIIALERGALDRWGRGDPSGYQEIYAPGVTYFDPMQDKRIDGLDAIKVRQAPIKGKVHVDRYDMIDPKVQRQGDIAVLTFNLISYRAGADGKETVVALEFDGSLLQDRRYVANHPRALVLSQARAKERVLGDASELRSGRANFECTHEISFRGYPTIREK